LRGNAGMWLIVLAAAAVFAAMASVGGHVN
jgi:hypothetical protein